MKNIKKPAEVTITEAQLRDMKRACYQHVCYKCKHQKKTAEEMEVCRQVEECEHCRAACARKTKGSKCYESIQGF